MSVMATPTRYEGEHASECVRSYLLLCERVCLQGPHVGGEGQNTQALIVCTNIES